tara:strand:+ start:417 stop:1574 length:1158 start_codon:yes stop_codon:yes gene_type:complete
MINLSLKDFSELKIKKISLILSNTKISGKMHGQKSNIKPLGFVTIELENGRKGISELYVATYISFGLDSIFEYLNLLLNDKSLKDAYEIVINLSVPFVSRNGIFRSCLGCLENAILDAIARLDGVPLYKLFQKNYKIPKIYASGGTVVYTPKEIEEESSFIKDQGFDGYKIRVGMQTWENDKKRISSIINDNNLKKMVDSICGTRTPPWSLNDALEKLDFLSDNNIYWLEEPLHPDNLSEHSLLQKNAKFHIAAGEAYSGTGEFKNFIEIGNTDVVQFDACHSGGISSCIEISDLASSSGKKNAIHVWGSLVAQLTNLHLSLVANDIDFLEYPLIDLEINNIFHFSQENIRKQFEKLLENPGIGISDESIEKIEENFVPGYEYKW